MATVHGYVLDFGMMNMYNQPISCRDIKKLPYVLFCGNDVYKVELTGMAGTRIFYFTCDMVYMRVMNARYYKLCSDVTYSCVAICVWCLLLTDLLTY